MIIMIIIIIIIITKIIILFLEIMYTIKKKKNLKNYLCINMRSQHTITQHTQHLNSKILSNIINCASLYNFITLIIVIIIIIIIIYKIIIKSCYFCFLHFYFYNYYPPRARAYID